MLVARCTPSRIVTISCSVVCANIGRTANRGRSSLWHGDMQNMIINLAEHGPAAIARSELCAIQGSHTPHPKRLRDRARNDSVEVPRPTFGGSPCIDSFGSFR